MISPELKNVNTAKFYVFLHSDPVGIKQSNIQLSWIFKHVNNAVKQYATETQKSELKAEKELVSAGLQLGLDMFSIVTFYQNHHKKERLLQI